MSVLGLVGDVVNAGLTMINNRKNRDFAEQQATTAYNRQIALMNMQNEYNSPSAQMHRFVDAGLNPNLIYGQLGNGLAAPSVSQGATPASVAPQFMSANRLVDAQIERLKTESNIDQQRLDNEVKQTLSSIGLNDANIQYLLSQRDVNNASIPEIEQRIAESSYRSRNLAWDIALKSAVFSDSVGLLAAQKEYTQKQAKAIGEYMAAETLGLRAQARLSLSQAKLNDKQAAIVEQVGQINQFQIDNYYKGKEFGFGVDIGGKHKVLSPYQFSLFNQGNSQHFGNLMLQKQVSILTAYGDKEAALNLIKLQQDVNNAVLEGLNIQADTKNKEDDHKYKPYTSIISAATGH